MTLVIEIGVPFLIFAPRRLRLFGAACLLTLQVLILLTGNYAFFNILTIALCLFLFDDQAFGRAARPLAPQPRPQRVAAALLAAVILILGLTQLIETFNRRRSRCASKVRAPRRAISNRELLRSVRRDDDHPSGNHRRRIGRWRKNGSLTSFRYKPGDLRRAPRWAAPHQPRLDWQMWFARSAIIERNLVRRVQRSVCSKARRSVTHSPKKIHSRSPASPTFVRASMNILSPPSRPGDEPANGGRQKRLGDYLPAIGLRQTALLESTPSRK